MTKAKQISLCAILLALSLTLSYMERFIPLQMVVPLPGFKLGLANIVTLLALCLFKDRYVLLILLCRCVLGAIFGGGITGLLFSLCGGIMAFGCMAAGKRFSRFSIYGISVMGAAAHNIGQGIAAMVLMNSVHIGLYLPYLLLIGILTGLLTGGICAGVLRVLPKEIKGMDL
jgi:heptaprenyl diphosphate synthase